MLNITEHKSGRNSVLKLEGNIILGGGSRKLGQEVRRVLAEGKKNILLDFGAVKYLDSSGVGELIGLANAVSEAEGTLKLCSLPEKVEEVLSLSSVLPLFEIYESETEASQNPSSAA